MIPFFRLALVFLLLCVVALLSAITTMHFAIHGAEVSVPDFRGLTTADAMRKAASLELNLSVDNHFYSAEMPSGRVLSQSPASGTVVRREWHVRITESLGPQRMAIPNVIGQPERAATIAIRRAGLDLGNVARMPYSGASASAVIAQNPAPDALGVGRPSMSLLVAYAGRTSADGTDVVMPDLTGQLFAAAAAAITHAGLKLTPTTVVPTSVPAVSVNTTQTLTAPVPPGTVTAQLPIAGHRVDANTTIQLTVAR
ncbi:PASTA domain-containing protein [Alloacidobacterium dinghuense]|uniref:PASTA domain-containing protein n=1 Tax=Alloacidobacterium dinghuense TaxID=2763107 RepID=A0A7G8BHV4_9BACT|nr:PASTA domain-containing protein [Alloacidobacterium dinghuense]QNI32124.1 PASTA domain-containing protein [Alloacidobacterium dinghuense]